jgi:lysine decarboxylase
MVDAAHGAHLLFLGDHGFQAADLVVTSAHKTLPALGQTALLLANGFSLDDLRRFGSVYGSSSPSYLMMSSLDLARDWMEKKGEKRYTETAKLVEVLRAKYPALRPGALNLEPTRFVLNCPDGFALAEALRAKHIYPEMADPTHVVFIFTAADGEPEVSRLSSALDDLLPTGKILPSRPDLSPPPLPRQILSPRKALFATRETIPLSDSAGRISACQAAPYPPGVPVIAPGELIEKKHLAYLNRIGYNRKQIEVVR